MSGLQLPEAAATGGMLDAARALAVTQTTTYRWSLADDLAGYARAGIGGIGLYRPKLEELEEDLAIDAIRSSGLTVTSLSWVGGFTGSDGRKQDEALYDAGEAVRLAAAVGAGTVAVCSGGSGQHIGRHARRLLNDALLPLCDMAAELDVRIALHPFASAGRPRSVITTIDETIEAIGAADRSNLGFVFDIAEFGAETKLVERVRDVASLVHVVRLSDRRLLTDRRRHFVDRSTPVAAVVNAFLDTGYDGPFEFDLWSDDDCSAADYEEVLADCRFRFESFGVPSEIVL
ncbi:MAG: sugar phosphate isomerase/epimerase [Planctomycetota bacterium]|nr:sugar phosphate isomerase/epimerase [Planctomycetaceae bacterium]MDQ3329523.1 sugar phosphate isomerase/epimerase [Planctomycetota bacterium]